MQAELKVKSYKPPSFYQRHILPALRRLFRGQRQSVWDLDVEDELDDGSRNPGSIILTIFLLGGVQAIFILLPAAYIVQLMFLHPDGLAGVIGQQLADVCIGGGSCDVGQLLASYAFAVLLLVNMIALIIYGVLAGAGFFDRPDPNDVPFAVAVTDEHVVTLHSELIAAKVLPEPVEDADDDL